MGKGDENGEKCDLHCSADIVDVTCTVQLILLVSFALFS